MIKSLELSESSETRSPDSILQSKENKSKENQPSSGKLPRENKPEQYKPKHNEYLVLVVEDDRSMLMMLESRLHKKGYQVITANDGNSALKQIEKHHEEIDVILLDRIMPDMDGLKIVELLKTRFDLSKMPIIMQTGSDTPEQVQEGIDAGVFYYLTKPIQEGILNSVLNSAVKESIRNKILRKEMEKHKVSFSLIQTAQFHLKNLEEAEDLACFIANSFPDPNKVIPGIAELLINAIEHGKCGITYEEKSALVTHDEWREEINRICKLKENKDKIVEVVFKRESDKLSLTISDYGKGFAWKKYMKVDPSRAMDNHGRGIARANMLFDQLLYNKEGNAVMAIIDPSLKDDIEW